MKTITELNSKWWYRFIKVLYILFFVISLGCSLILPPVIYLNPYEKSIHCANGINVTSKQLSDKGIYINSYDQETQRENEVKIKRICVPDTMYISRIKMQQILDERPDGTTIDEIITAFVKNGWILEGFNSLPNKIYKEYSAEEFSKISYEVKKEVKWLELIEVLFASVFGTLIFFEILRRSFYYVVLGSIKPTK